MKRVIIVVLDSVGMGELPDADKYGDTGSNTLGNIAKTVSGFSLPNLEKLGLGNIDGMTGFKKVDAPLAAYARMSEMSAGKDTTTGHWELAGIILEKPFPVYPDGFPPEVLDKFRLAIGTDILGNVSASGTEIINRLGDQHVKTGYPIVYTSADSVFQIAAHEDIIPIEKLYEMCKAARSILSGEHAVGRVIARPFTGTTGNYTRTSRRHDYSLDPIDKTVLDYTVEKGLKVKAVGKIVDIFNNKGITDTVHTKNNMEGVDRTLEYLQEEFEGIIFTNLVDFDMVYGHRNNAQGYADALTEFDKRLPEILASMKEDDVLMITADHGCDPTTPNTDHSREYVPLLVCGKKLQNGKNLGTRKTFADVAATVSEFLQTRSPRHGNSFMKELY